MQEMEIKIKIYNIAIYFTILLSIWTCILTNFKHVYFYEIQLSMFIKKYCEYCLLLTKRIDKWKLYFVLS